MQPQSTMASPFDQMCVTPQCGHFTEFPVSTDRRNDSGSIVIPVLTGLPVVGHVIEIAPTVPPCRTRTIAAIGGVRNLGPPLSRNRRTDRSRLPGWLLAAQGQPVGDSAVIRPSRRAVVTDSATVVTTPVQVTIHAGTAAVTTNTDAGTVSSRTRLDAAAGTLTKAHRIVSRSNSGRATVDTTARRSRWRTEHGAPQPHSGAIATIRGDGRGARSAAVWSVGTMSSAMPRDNHRSASFAAYRTAVTNVRCRMAGGRGRRRPWSSPDVRGHPGAGLGAPMGGRQT